MLTTLLNWLFPIACACCGAEDEWLCARCQRHVGLLDTQPPPPVGIDVTYCATLYQPPVADLIQSLKYGSARAVAPILGDLLVRCAGEIPRLDRPLLVPVPLHRRRRRERGFNQSHLLAGYVSQQLDWEVQSNLLLRRRYTSQQAKLDRAQRLHNLTDAFTLTDPLAIRGRHVVIVDDVLTTGATLTACAAALREASPASVIALCVAYDETK